MRGARNSGARRAGLPNLTRPASLPETPRR